MKGNLIGAPLLALAASLWFGVALNPAHAADETGSVQKQLLELTGGRHAKVVWNQNEKLKLFDTQDGVVQDLPFFGGAPLLTSDGLRVLATIGKSDDRSLMMYDTKTKKATTVTKGPDSNLLTIWRDPKTKRDWIYVNDGGSKEQAWDAPYGKIHRFPLDKPAAKELFWDRTTSHFYLMFSADGTRACFEPTWTNIGQLSVVYDAKGKCDQEKSVFKPIGAGCFPGLAPDNSYRMFRLEGDHQAIGMTDADGANPRKIKINEMPGVAGKACWLTRWGTHPRFLSLMGPDGEEARTWVGRFDEQFTKIEAWVQITAEGPKCWQSHVWVDPQRPSTTAPKRK